MRFKIVEVEWEDAALTTSWNPSQGEQIPGTSVARTVGYLIERTEKRTVLAFEVFPEDSHAREIQAIPAGMIRKVRTLGHMDTAE